MLVPSLAFALLLVAQDAPVEAAPAAPAARDVIGELGPTTSAPVTVGTARYLPLASGGVAIVDVTDAAAPRVVGRLLEGRVVSRLVLVDGQLMALVLRQDALMFSLADPLAPVSALPLLPISGVAETTTIPTPPTRTRALPSPAEPTAKAPAVSARVIEVTGGRVIFDGGVASGFTKGSRVRIVSQQLVAKPNLAGNGTTQVASGEVTAVVGIEEAEPTRAMAKLGRGDVAFPGDVVELAPEAALSERLFLPRRAPFTVRAGFHARPFLGLGSTSVGFLVDGYATYYFSSVPLSITVELAPIGFALGSQDAHFPMTAAGLVAYTTDFFEIGVGAGALLGNPGPCFQEFDPISGLPTSGGLTCEVNTGPTINQTLRLGSVDGLHVAWASSIFVRSPEGFVFGMGRAELGVPVSSTLGLFAAGGGGENGWGFGEVGVRSFFGGTGAPGTVMLSASLGGAGVFDGPNHENVIGPSVAFGMEWRL